MKKYINISIYDMNNRDIYIMANSYLYECTQNDDYVKI